MWEYQRAPRAAAGVNPLTAVILAGLVSCRSGRRDALIFPVPSQRAAGKELLSQPGRGAAGGGCRIHPCPNSLALSRCHKRLCSCTAPARDLAVAGLRQIPVPVRSAPPSMVALPSSLWLRMQPSGAGNLCNPPGLTAGSLAAGQGNAGLPAVLPFSQPALGHSSGVSGHALSPSLPFKNPLQLCRGQPAFITQVVRSAWCFGIKCPLPGSGSAGN